MNIDKVIAIENRLRRVTSAMVTLGATPEAIADLNVAGDIFSEVRHFMVCAREDLDADRDPAPTVIRLVRFIHPDPMTLRNADYLERMSTGQMGGFKAALHEAWTRADLGNRAKIEAAFPGVF